MSGLALVLGQGFVMNWFYSKIIGLEIRRFWKSVLPIYVFPVIIAVVTILIGKYLIDFYRIIPLVSGIVLFTFVYIVYNWCLVMNGDEKGIVKSFIRR